MNTDRTDQTFSISDLFNLRESAAEKTYLFLATEEHG